MNLPKRTPPGPMKKFERYFTIPINRAIHEGLEKLKWRTQLDKTEVARRLIEYILSLPPDSQDKLLRSFDKIREQENKKFARPKKEKIPTATYIDERQQEAPKAVTPIRVIKRSGLP